jgi:hypothetical protein
VDVPQRPWLDLAVGTVDDAPPATFAVGVREGDRTAAVFEHTVTTPHRWEPQAVDLTPWAGRRVTLSLALTSDEPGAIGLWGLPSCAAASRLTRAATTRAPPWASSWYRPTR